MLNSAEQLSAFGLERIFLTKFKFFIYVLLACSSLKVSQSVANIVNRYRLTYGRAAHFVLLQTARTVMLDARYTPIVYPYSTDSSAKDFCHLSWH